MQRVALPRGDELGPGISAAAARPVEAAGVPAELEPAPAGLEGVRPRGAPIPRALATVCFMER